MASRAISRLLLAAVAISASIALAKPQDAPARPGRPNYPGGGVYSRPAWLPSPSPSPAPDPAPPTEPPASPSSPGNENGSGGQESDGDQETPGTGNSGGGTDGGIGGGIVTPGDENPTKPAVPGSQPPSGSPGPGSGLDPGSGSGSGDSGSGSPTNTNGNGDDNDNADGMGQADSSGASGGDLSDNRTLVITLSSVLSVVALFLIMATMAACYRAKNGRLPFLPRGTSPIDDEEIESWKRGAVDEKFTSRTAVTRLPSTAGSVKKPPSVIIYNNTPLASGAAAAADVPEHPSPRSIHTVKRSLDLAQPSAAVIARAPNSRPGLTDETVEGDKAFIASAPPAHRRQHSRRLSKATPPRHKRTRSNRSSVSLSNSYRDAQYHYHQHYHWHGPTASASAGPSPRASNEYSYYYPRTSHSYDRKHSRIYSSSSIPPRASFDDEYYAGALSPRPLLAGMNGTPESEIGRAIG